MSMQKKLMVIVGATASGKSAYALAMAKKIKGEIINADSRQMYKDAQIGVAKPVFEEMRDGVGYLDKIPHHLFFEFNADERVSVVAFQKKAFEIIDEIIARGNMPILVGGTGYYVQAVVDNMRYGENDYFEETVETAKKPLSELLEELKKISEQEYARVDRGNSRRVARAIVRLKHGLPDVVQQTPLYDCEMIGLDVPKQILHQRIEQRVDEMLRDGLIKETEKLIDLGGEHAPILDSIGYKEVMNFLRGEIDKKALRDLIILRTQQYAKRQMTWLKRDARVRWISS